MYSFILEVLFIMVPLAISLIIYMKIDKKYAITNIISLKLGIKREWMAFFCFCFTILIMLTINMINEYVINILPIVYFILGGIFTGMVVGVKYSK
ncbi:hypothetical protein [Clostridium septicum]|uniref:Uncharacterized protein n=1 Tax=Clostridium septicum TaxID=1504 RepID=A0A9N7PI02_CLOSE|nr:hypothetical protein [Clostridium septicum]AYE33251.1 hypothetical protein CP523_01630 [Clostridium septicum]MDU1313017.1 hypothetical protein [Clostridium septicum]QAS61424.1 hypothetical protein EI377_12160 [Clostridium septicum]UEC22145.1 hypothetical protein LK444_07245 [Clostridium septicum]USR99825.1 hypothetical protein NH397_09945 [Clostridium septicum]